MPLDLPAVLVEDVLRGSEDASASLLDSIRGVQAGRAPVRRWLEDEGLLLRGPDDDAGAATACGIDGSYVLDHMLTASVAACAAVAIEGFAPPRHGGFWPVRHRSFVGVEAHSDDMPVMVRGLMRMMEAGLAAAAPHEVVLLDGSAASQIIHAHQAMSAACRPGPTSACTSTTSCPATARGGGGIEPWNLVLACQECGPKGSACSRPAGASASSIAGTPRGGTTMRPPPRWAGWLASSGASRGTMRSPGSAGTPSPSRCRMRAGKRPALGDRCTARRICFLMRGASCPGKTAGWRQAPTHSAVPRPVGVATGQSRPAPAAPGV